MGNKLSFFLLHGRRFKNRYNAQYRALEYIGEENRPSAPRHPSSNNEIASGENLTNSQLFSEFQKKNLQLDEYLKDVYIRSYDKIPEDTQSSTINSKRPLPESREPKPKATYKDPEEVEVGCCTISQISEFIIKHGDDPIVNSPEAIAKKYNLEEKKVENVIRYFTIFRVYDVVKDSLPKDPDEVEPLPSLPGNVDLVEKVRTYSKLYQSPKEQRQNAQGKEEIHSESDGRCQPKEKAMKN